MMAHQGKYLYCYCIIRCPEERTLGSAKPVGDWGSLVHTVSQGGLAAVVSDSPTLEYECTRANMLAHQRVLEEVMKDFTLLPVRFGTVADSSSPTRQVQRLLETRLTEFDRLLADVEGKVELGLKAFWRDEKAVFEEVLAQNEHIRRLRDLLRGKSPAETHFDRMHLGEMVKEALGQKRSAQADTLLVPLRQIATRTVTNPVLVDRMVLNAAFLVDKAREKEFDLAVSELDRRVGHRVAIRYVGPVPPYNFVNIVVNWQEL